MTEKPGAASPCIEDLHHLVDQLAQPDLERLADFAHGLRHQGAGGRGHRAALREWTAHFVARLPQAQQRQAWGDLHWLVGEATAWPTTEEAADLAQAREEDDVPWEPVHAEPPR